MSQRPSPAEGRPASVALRLASISDGRVIGEHVIRDRGALRDGAMEVGAGVGAITIAIVGARAELRGRLCGTLQQRGSLQRIETDALDLSLHDQGRLEVDGAVWLFQVIEPPAERRPQGLPASLRSGATLDARFTAIAMASLLAHFMFVVVLENLDPPYVSASVLPARAVEFMMDAPERPVLPPDERPPIERPDEGEEIATSTTTSTTPSRPSHPSRPTEPRGPSVAPEDTARLLADVATGISRGLLGALDPSATAAPGAGAIMESAGEVPTTSVPGSTLATRSGGGTVDPGGLGRLAGTLESGPVTEGSAIAEHEPVGVVRPPGLIEEPSPGLLDPRTVNGRVRERMGAIRNCYNQELRVDPTAGGRLEVSFAVQMTGEVNEVRIAEDTVGSPRMAECVVRVFRGMRRFTPGPSDGVARFTYPLVFVLGE